MDEKEEKKICTTFMLINQSMIILSERTETSIEINVRFVGLDKHQNRSKITKKELLSGSEEED